MEQLAVSLLVWIAAHSPYPVGDVAPPPIVLLSPEAMTAIVYEDTGTAQQAPKVDQQLQGYFDPDEGAHGTIFLVRPEDTPGAWQHAEPSDNPLFRERLLHELVHFAQHTTGEYERFRCPTQGELQAYDLGGKYLQQLGVPDPIPNRKLIARMLVRC